MNVTNLTIGSVRVNDKKRGTAYAKRGTRRARSHNRAGFCSSSRVPLSALHMKFLFVHQNFPGQYLHLVRHLAAIAGNEVVFITQRTDASLPGVKKIVYQPARQPGRGTHHYLREAEGAVLNA